MVVRRVAFAILVQFLVFGALPLSAQEPVRCRSGLYCQSGMTCLADGFCGVHKDILCWPGYEPASKGCMPVGSIECGDHTHCPSGEQCTPLGCRGGKYTGPDCTGNGSRCRAGQACNPYTGNCYDPRSSRFCGQQVCHIQAACGEAGECLNIVGERIPQAPLSAFAAQVTTPNLTVDGTQLDKQLKELKTKLNWDFPDTSNFRKCIERLPGPDKWLDAYSPTCRALFIKFHENLRAKLKAPDDGVSLRRFVGNQVTEFWDASKETPNNPAEPYADNPGQTCGLRSLIVQEAQGCNRDW